jgi:nitronate monooxygenase
MTGWPDHRILDLFGIDLPILQSPMAGTSTPEMAIAVGRAGALGALACAHLSPDEAREELATIRAAGRGPTNVNFFCHTPPVADATRMAAWRTTLAPYYRELGLDPETAAQNVPLAPFDEPLCRFVEEVRPEVVSFHFGLPARPLLDRVRATGAKIIASATIVAEARWLEQHGCDAIIAQGLEAGGHRGSFLSDDIARQVGTLALVPQIVDAVKVPVIAAGGIADARGIVAALALGAAAVQVGTAYMLSPEARISPVHRKALQSASAEDSALTNLLTGRPARCIVNRLMRELGPISAALPAFPLAAGPLVPLKAKAEAAGSADFSFLWSGQAGHLAREAPVEDITRRLGAEALAVWARTSAR